MTLTEKIFALKSIPPFDRLDYSELATIAKVARLKHRAPGEQIATAGQVLHYLFVVLRGEIVRSSGDPLPRVSGIQSLLLGSPLSCDITASPSSGADYLLFSKGHFFRIINEFPDFTVGLVQDAGQENIYQSVEVIK